MRYYSFIHLGGTVFSILFFLGFFIKEVSVHAQTNLVLNPSFEDYNTCPFDITSSYAISNYLYNWSVPSFSSTDYFNSCSMGNASVPVNYFGYQNAKTDNAYIGIYSWVVAPSDGREYIMGKLSSPLIKEYTYCVTFFVNLADGKYVPQYGYSSVNMAIENIGLFFSRDSVSFSTSKNLPFIPHIVNNNGIIADTKNWTEISGTYTAKGGEKWFIIGNFSPDSTTNKIWLKPQETSMTAAYYYIDDVSVVLCEDTAVATDTFTLHIPNIFTPNTDGTNDAWQVQATGVQQLSAAVYNRWGTLLWQQEVFADTTQQKTALNLTWNGTSNTGIPVSAGTYFYLVTYTTRQGETKKEKGFVTLVR